MIDCRVRTKPAPGLNQGADNFVADMGEPPTDKHQIDRIDNDKGYSPDNCRWATRKENMRNRSVNRIIEWNGEARCLAEWVDRIYPQLRLSYKTLHARINLYGWPVEKAFTTPPRNYKR